MTADAAARFLNHPIPSDIAAGLLGVDPDLFAGSANLTLRIAFRQALKPLLSERHAARGARRAVLRRQIVANRRAVSSISAERLSAALAVTARQLVGQIEDLAALLAPFDRNAAERLAGELERIAEGLRPIDPHAETRMRKSAAAIRVANVSEAMRITQKSNGETT